MKYKSNTKEEVIILEAETKQEALEIGFIHDNIDELVNYHGLWPKARTVVDVTDDIVTIRLPSEMLINILTGAWTLKRKRSKWRKIGIFSFVRSFFTKAKS